MAVILLRHTEPNIAPGTCYGQTDLDLVAGFPEHAAAIIRALPAIDHIVSSPLQRCHKLAEFIAADRDLSVQLDPRLMEMDFGRWERQPWNDVPRVELEAWASDFLHARPHEGESIAVLRARVLAALAEASTKHTTLVVTHAGVIRAALSTGDTAAHFDTKIEFGGMVFLP